MSKEGLKTAILQLPEQFAWHPAVKNEVRLPLNYESVVACGMGGSSLTALLVRDLHPMVPILVHRDYGLPDSTEVDLERSLIIVSSFSGNTEEALSAFEEARQKNLSVAALSAGGKLLQMAHENSIPYIKLPDPGVQTNHALGLYVIAFLQLLKEESLLTEARDLALTLFPLEHENAGRQLAQRLVDKTVHIYASWRNEALAYNWKIRLDESGKILTSCNFFPELNHGEIEAVCATALRGSSGNSYFLFLQDPDEDPRVAKRMAITAQLYQEKGLSVETVDLSGATKLERFFSSTILADWTTYYLALHYDHDPEVASFVEEFKERMSL